MAKISKAASAPNGDINVSIGTVSFSVNNSPYTTDDRVVIETIKASYPDLFVVVDDAPAVEVVVEPVTPTEPESPVVDDWKE
jgi:hypothetical protein